MQRNKSKLYSMKQPGWRSKVGNWLNSRGFRKFAMRFYKAESRKKPNYYAYIAYATLLYSAPPEKKASVIEETIDWVESSLSLNPQYPIAHLELGTLYRHKIDLLLQRGKKSVIDLSNLRELIKKSQTHLERAKKLDSGLEKEVNEQIDKLQNILSTNVRVIIRPIMQG